MKNLAIRVGNKNIVAYTLETFRSLRTYLKIHKYISQ